MVPEGLPPTAIKETSLGETESSIFMVRRGDGLPLFYSFFGLGAADKSFPDPSQTFAAMSEVLTGEENIPGAFAVYNTRPDFSVQEAKVNTADFLGTEIAGSFAESLAEMETILAGNKVVSTYESYSGALFLAMLVASLGDPLNPVAAGFLTNLGKTTDRVAVLAPGIAISKYPILRYPGFKLPVLKKIVMTENLNAAQRQILKRGGLDTEIESMAKSGHYLDKDHHKMLTQYLARVRHLVLFERVYDDFVNGLVLPVDVTLPKIIMISHPRDNLLEHKVNCRAVEPLVRLGIVEVRSADKLIGKDPHCLYADAENRKPLHSLIFD